MAQRDLISRYRMMAETPSPQSLSLTGRGAKDNTFDCHPLIREYFGRQLKESQFEVWRQAHTVLYEYYKGLPEKLWGKYLPDTLEEIQPLLRAIKHGCNAKLYQISLDDVYWPRINRKLESYLQHRLGAFDSDLMVLSNFFDKPWTTLSENLEVFWQGGILNWTGLALRSRLRYKESLSVNKSDYYIQSKFEPKNYQSLVYTCINLSEINLILGNSDKAGEFSLEAVMFSNDKNVTIMQRVFSLSCHANFLFNSGLYRDSLEFYSMAETQQLEDR